jgi:C_GCAxxG_C_C family probable redox protein
MTKSEQAVSKFLDGFLCSQAILSTYGPDNGLDSDLALKLATGLGGGMGRLGQTCGAVTGAILVVGLKKGAVIAEDIASREATYNVVKKFLNRFEKQNGSTICRDLLSCDISKPEEYQRAKEQNLFQTLCPRYVESAVMILENVLEIKL